MQLKKENKVKQYVTSFQSSWNYGRENLYPIF